MTHAGSITKRTRARRIPVAWRLVLGCALVIGLLAGCGSSSPTLRRDNLVNMYGKGSTQLRLEARVHHADASNSTIYFKLHTRDLLYKSDGGGGPYKANVRVSYGTFADWDAKQLLDSASTLVHDVSNDTDEDRELIGRIDLRRTPQRFFLIRVVARDLNRDNESTVVLRVDPDEVSMAKYFMPTDPRNGLPYFDDHLMPGQEVRVRCDLFTGRTLFGSHHPNDESLPTPVFASGPGNHPDPPSDSTFTVQVGDDGRFDLRLDKPGVYYFRLDTSISGTTGSGLSLFVLADSYPIVGTATDMLKPLRYITSMQEFDRIQKAPDTRKAIERFWLDAAGERERAREAIRIYYSRVENANRHFSALVEGWRTDRGLVHIIFGVPTTIYKNDRSETWIYGEENNLMSLTFNFVKRTSTFSDNDLVLDRDPMLKGAWYRNVESWRNARVYQN